MQTGKNWLLFYSSFTKFKATPSVIKVILTFDVYALLVDLPFSVVLVTPIPKTILSKRGILKLGIFNKASLAELLSNNW